MCSRSAEISYNDGLFQKNAAFITMQSNLAPEAYPASFTPFLCSSRVVDSTHPEIVDFAQSRTVGTKGSLEKSIALYYAVRDELRYDPYSIEMTDKGLSASTTLNSGTGWCVSKSVLLAAACRVIGVPARLGFADVKNHLSTANLRESMGTDIFYWHGYTSIYLNEQWVKATPAFNIELCEKFRIKPLEFDGQADSIYHPYDLDGRQHMEYVNERGEYADVPIEEMKADFHKYYPNLSFIDSTSTLHHDFEREVEQENR